MDSKSRDAEDREFEFGYYVVCLIDLLGQKEALSGWAQLPHDGQATPTIMTAIKHTAGTVLSVQDAFREYFGQSLQSHMPQEAITLLPQHMRDFVQRMRDFRLSTQQFSDTFVLYAPLLNSRAEVTVLPLYHILSACGMIMITCLGSRVPIRGAICIGTGTELAAGNIYGPALAEAHRMESKEAQYPRIIVSPEAAELKRAITGFSRNPLDNRSMRAVAAKCQSFLSRDGDGRMVVDYLGESMKATWGSDLPQLREIVTRGYEFVLSEGACFTDACNDKLGGRYSSLRQYMESRLPIWGLTPRVPPRT